MNPMLLLKSLNATLLRIYAYLLLALQIYDNLDRILIGYLNIHQDSIIMESESIFSRQKYVKPSESFNPRIQ